MRVVADIVAAYRQQDIKTKVLAASIRNPMHVTQAALAGADIATMPFGVLKMLFLHPLTEAGQKKFLEDYRQARAASGSKADGGARAQPDERSEYRKTQEAKPVPTTRQEPAAKR
jgi:transaldolase